ncbi:unnamed protein product [Brassica oleracea]
MLTRQLVVEDKHTLWSVFGSDPIKFGLQEFGTITGLPCGAFPVGYTTDKEDQSQAHKDPYWIELIGKKRFTTIADLRRKLETDKHMPGPQKLRLALIIIVDDVNAFCLHPWGRESFLKTITCMKPPKFVPLKCEDPTGKLVELLEQETLMLKGSPLALQLLAYQTAPNLLSTIPIPFDSHSIMDLVVPHLPLYPVPSINDILSVEADPDLIADNYHFEKHLWHGGDTSQPITTPATDEDEPILQEKSRKSKAPRKKAAKSKPPPKKCSQTEEDIKEKLHDPTSNDKILELLSAISEQTTKLSDQHTAPPFATHLVTLLPHLIVLLR